MNAPELTTPELIDYRNSPLRFCVKRLDNRFLLLYRLCSETANDNSIYKNAFFISVTKIPIAGGIREVCTVRDVTRLEDEALRIYDIVTRGRVTPCVLREVLSDLCAV